jgi:hypothetical protein
MSCDSSGNHPKSKSKSKPELRPGAARTTAVQRAELEVLRQKTVDLAKQNPQKAAVILSSWINGGALKRKKAG